MVTKNEMLKGLDALEDLIRSQEHLKRDALICIHEQGLWAKFMKYHGKNEIKRMVKRGDK